MKKNMGTADRVIRTLIAIVVAILYFTNVIGGTLALVLGIIAVIFLLTSLVGSCPAYLPLGISTCAKEEPPAPAAPAAKP
jgi:Inner membrane protein YgaP-like, transmembrane domain